MGWAGCGWGCWVQPWVPAGGCRGWNASPKCHTESSQQDGPIGIWLLCPISSRADIRDTGHSAHRLSQGVLDQQRETKARLVRERCCWLMVPAMLHSPALSSGVWGFCTLQVRAMRLSFVGELGWELHVPREDCVRVYQAVMEAGARHGITNAGYRAIDSLSIEKGLRLSLRQHLLLCFCPNGQMAFSQHGGGLVRMEDTRSNFPICGLLLRVLCPRPSEARDAQQAAIPASSFCSPRQGDPCLFSAGYRHWHADLRPDDTPLEAGLAFTCKLKSSIPFLGREAVEAQKSAGIFRRLVCFTTDE